MIPNDHDRIRELYLEASELNSDKERREYLARRCGADLSLIARVEAMLKMEPEAGDFFKPFEAGAPDTESANGPEPTVAEEAGSVIGRYKLLERIGEGGFGVVYMAEQIEPVRRRVALKIIKLGMDTREVIARFSAERQALALMDHPNVARVLDAGATASGRPYFVMELVRGLPITQYCDRNRLSTRERIELFAQVCHAAQHAHSKGIIHRDLKPSNVLVTCQDGHAIPKVIDFGIAKAVQTPLTDQTLFTRFGQMVGTPVYMSPEHLDGVDIDTRSDVYSLGVILYELLTGRQPFDLGNLKKAGHLEIIRVIREEDPPRPSTKLTTLGAELAAVATCRNVSPRHLGELLRGDLDWITMKALRKNRAERYSTPLALAEDLQRHLENRVVLAGPPRLGYRA
jgi:serine/threonine protein kinase